MFSFDLALRFGQTRRRALGLALGVISFETAFAMALGGALAALERLEVRTSFRVHVFEKAEGAARPSPGEKKGVSP